MILRHSRCAFLAALAIIFGLEPGESQARLRRIGYAPGGIVYESNVPGPVAYSLMYPPYSPYIMPLPGYGVLPPHLASNPWHYYGIQRQDAQFPAPRGQVPDLLDYTPRKRNALHPAMPFERTPEEQLADRRRVRFEIHVPDEKAVVFFDGVATKQAGLTRVFVTPPMDEDREYTAMIRVEFMGKESKTPKKRQREFTLVAGQTVKHTFVE